MNPLEQEQKKNRTTRRRLHLKFREESVAGAVSCGCFLLEAILFAGGILYSFIKAGNAGYALGFLSFGIFALGVIGLVAAIGGMRRKEKTHRLCKVGIYTNLVTVLGMITVYLTGIFSLI